MRELDEAQTRYLVSRYRESDDWTLRAIILVSLGWRWHPAAETILLEALDAKDPRLVVFAVEALWRTDPAWLPRVASKSIVEALMKKLGANPPLLRKRVGEVLRRLAPEVKDDNYSWQTWWQKVKPNYREGGDAAGRVASRARRNPTTRRRRRRASSRARWICGRPASRSFLCRCDRQHAADDRRGAPRAEGDREDARLDHAEAQDCDCLLSRRERFPRRRARPLAPRGFDGARRDAPLVAHGGRRRRHPRVGREGARARGQPRKDGMERECQQSDRDHGRRAAARPRHRVHQATGARGARASVREGAGPDRRQTQQNAAAADRHLVRRRRRVEARGQGLPRDRRGGGGACGKLEFEGGPGAPRGRARSSRTS